MESVTAVLIVAAATFILLPDGVESRISDAVAERFPVEGVERLQAVNPDVRLFAEYGWGGYAIHELYRSGGRVFVDGRNDMYDQRILEDYSAIRAADDGWKQLVDAYDVEAILLPPNAPLVRGFAQDAGWCEIVRDELQVLMVRECIPKP